MCYADSAYYMCDCFTGNLTVNMWRISSSLMWCKNYLNWLIFDGIIIRRELSSFRATMCDLPTITEL